MCVCVFLTEFIYLTDYKYIANVFITFFWRKNDSIYKKYYISTRVSVSVLSLTSDLLILIKQILSLQKFKNKVSFGYELNSKKI